ncbi:hypothetical protein CAL65_16425 [Alkalilimnicola ehrlichii]|uniref:TonB-dependent receptor n=1 Tax=Alkalilimnicola ehrlichii TaxID=351052 RepID=A0A3E0WLU3_9GAMM|nr:hypothetical protein CAL65_16425 [Alkalilimnicola ehrlichii]
MQKNRLTAAMILAGAVPFTAFAEQQLEPVVVTPGRTAQTMDESLAAVSVITREDIERIQPPTLTELLRLQPGIDVVRSGSFGTNTSVFLRGTNSNHTLVLIDGVRASSATTGQFAWESVDPAQIERIEIVRGPRAALYGSEAIGGVIQIFTREPQGITARAEYGSFNTRRVDVGYGGGDTIRYHINGSWVDTDGFPPQRSDTEDRGYTNRSVNGGITAPLWGEATASLTGWVSQGDLEFSNGEQETENRAINFRFEDQLMTNWFHSLQISYALDELTTAGAQRNKITTHRRSIDWQNNFALTDRQMIISGVNYYKDHGRNRNLAAGVLDFDESASNYGIFASYLGNFDFATFEVSARHDDHEEFGGETTGSTAIGIPIAPNTQLRLSYGTAFKAPTLNNLYHPGFGGFWGGNLDLEPSAPVALKPASNTVTSTNVSQYLSSIPKWTISSNTPAKTVRLLM